MYFKLAQNFFPATFCFNERESNGKAVKAMEILSREQMRCPRKM